MEILTQKLSAGFNTAAASSMMQPAPIPVLADQPPRRIATPGQGRAIGAQRRPSRGKSEWAHYTLGIDGVERIGLENTDAALSLLRQVEDEMTRELWMCDAVLRVEYLDTARLHICQVLDRHDEAMDVIEALLAKPSWMTARSLPPRCTISYGRCRAFRN